MSIINTFWIHYKPSASILFPFKTTSNQHDLMGGVGHDARLRGCMISMYSMAFIGSEPIG